MRIKVWATSEWSFQWNYLTWLPVFCCLVLKMSMSHTGTRMETTRLRMRKHVEQNERSLIIHCHSTSASMWHDTDTRVCSGHPRLLLSKWARCTGGTLPFNNETTGSVLWGKISNDFTLQASWQWYASMCACICVHAHMWVVCVCVCVNCYSN